MKEAKIFIEYLNTEFTKLHESYEKAFWDFNMGISTDGSKMRAGSKKVDAFRSNKKLKLQTEQLLKKSKGDIKKKLSIWNNFFSLFQVPEQASKIREKVAELEEKMQKEHSTRKEGYIDPKTNTFVEASRNKMRSMMRTEEDEEIRKSCFLALEQLPLSTLDTYIETIKYRNEYSRILGYEDFYDYKIHLDEGMTKDELFKIFEKVYESTKYAFKNIRDMEKDKPGLRKPWNFGYMMTGNFVREEEPYFQFENVVSHWGRSFSALGIDYKGGELKLDLLDRKGKHDNGFCHYPKIVHYNKGKYIPAASNFTSNAIPNQLGSGIDGIHTVFHEAGHAADRLNSIQSETCLNTEYPPATVSWAETQSMFMDSISSSIEWKMRYAKDVNGNSYPFDIFKRKVEAIYPLIPLEMMSIIFVMDFERQIYECKDLTKEFVLDTAKAVYRKYFDRSEDSISILNTPHIYSWESSAYYHGYGLAELGVHQWREYFYKKYGYVVDNPNVGREMRKVWKYGSLYKSGKYIKMATGKPLSADCFIKNVTKPLPEILKMHKKRIARLKKVKEYTKPVKLNAKISIVHGKDKIADNKKSFEDMEMKFRKWILGLK